MKRPKRSIIKKVLLTQALAIAVMVFAGAANSFAATLRVDPDARNCAASDLGPFATIQGALSAAQPGDTIFVCPNYTETGVGFNTTVPYAGPITVTIPNLTLIGVSDGDDSRILIGGNADTPNVASESTGIVTLDALNITFGNFTVDGSALGANAGVGRFNGVVVTDDASGTTVFNTTVRNILNANNAASGFGNGIVVEGGTAALPVFILNNVVTNFRTSGIIVGDVAAGNNAARALVRGNYVAGTTISNSTQRGIVFDNSGGSTVTGDIFNNRVVSISTSGNTCSAAAPAFAGCGSAYLLSAVAAGGVTVRFNQSFENIVGFWAVDTSNITFNNNTVGDSEVGFFIFGSSNTMGSNFNIVQQNLTFRTARSIELGTGTDTSAGNTIRQNTFQDSQYGVVNLAISTTIGAGATANTYIQIDNNTF